MKVQELIEWLKDFDQNAEVVTVEHLSSSSHYEQGGTAYIAPFDPEVTREFEFILYKQGKTWEYEVDTKGNARLLLGVYNG
jgi:hypothetical protein